MKGGAQGISSVLGGIGSKHWIQLECAVQRMREIARLVGTGGKETSNWAEARDWEMVRRINRTPTFRPNLNRRRVLISFLLDAI
jgi:hypothetical protein